MVTLRDFERFDDFVKAIIAAGSIRLVKLEEYGFTKPVVKNGAVFIQPMVRVVATAFDKSASAVYRWQETADAKPGDEAGPLTATEQVRELLQLEGFGVERGEWSPGAVEALLKRTGS